MTTYSLDIALKFLLYFSDWNLPSVSFCLSLCVYVYILSKSVISPRHERMTSFRCPVGLRSAVSFWHQSQALKKCSLCQLQAPSCGSGATSGCYSMLVGRAITCQSMRLSSSTRLSGISVGVPTGADRLGRKSQNGIHQYWH